MTTGEIILWSAFILVGVVGSALCSGMETGLYSINRVRLNILSSEESVAFGSRRWARLLQRELARPARLLATLLIANTFFNNLGSIGTSALLEHEFSTAAVVILNVVILTPLLFVLSDAMPKELFRLEADRLTYPLAPVLVAGRWLLTVTLILPAIELIVRLITRWLKLREESTLGGQRQTIAALLKEGARHGVLSASQASLLDRALLLRNTTIRGEMTPWSQVQTISTTWDRSRVAQFVAHHHRSRYPVVDTTGSVIGVVEHLDLCVHADRSARELAHPPVFLDADGPVRDGLVQMRSTDARLGVVRQSGRPIGIVTMADLIEPLIGPEPSAPQSSSPPTRQRPRNASTAGQ